MSTYIYPIYAIYDINCTGQNFPPFNLRPLNLRALLSHYKVFKALGFGSASLDLGIGGKVVLWEEHRFIPCHTRNKCAHSDLDGTLIPQITPIF